MTPPPRFGLGFRTPHFAELCANAAGVDWLELLTDNTLGVGGPRRAMLEALRTRFPLALHGVGLGIANDEPPRASYVAALRTLADEIEPLFVSDHLCWTGLGGVHSHDLLPVAGTREVLALVAERVARVQDALGRRILLENASAYVKFRDDELSEAELLAALCQRTGCGVLLDVNNLFVNATNLGSDPRAALAALAPRHVGYLHVAGHTTLPDVCIDTHGTAVQEEVWRLFEHAVRRFPAAGVMLERDDALPALGELVGELDVARARWHAAQREPLASACRPARCEPAHASAPAPLWRDTQRAFWTSLAPGEAEDSPAPIEAALDARGPVTPQRGLRVYREALASLAERILGANFPTLARVLSRRDFVALCEAFARAHPPRGHDYASFGAPLADFVAHFALADRYDVAQTAFADIARLEQAQLEAQEAPDATGTVAPLQLAAIPADGWEELACEFAPALRVVSAEYDVLPAIRAVANGAPLALPAGGEIGYLVARASSGVATERIEPSAARGLRALAAGARFGEACASEGGELAAPALARALALACAREGVRELRVAAV